MSSILFAQAEQKKAKPKFQSIMQVGLLEGETGSAFQLQTINGFKFKNFSAGVGVGLDYYSIRSIPLFLDLRKNILNKDQTPFVYVDAGIHFPWTGKQFDWATETDGGLFYDLGIGYRLPVKYNAFLLSAGYSLKAYSAEERYSYWCGINPCPEIVNQYEYKLRRFSVKFGFSF
jgi:hypothetical protein